MRVKGIAIKGLFGVFNHEIPLQSPDRVSIIFGPNGFGKTVMLRMIAAAVQGDTKIFEDIPFDEFSITLDDGRSGVIRRRLEASPVGSARVNLTFLMNDGAGNISEVEANEPKLPNSTLRMIDRHVPTPYHVSGSGWTDGVREYSPRQIFRMFPRAAQAAPKSLLQDSVIFDFCREIPVFFVETNRLAAESAPRKQPMANTYLLEEDEEISQPTLRVNRYSEDIVQRIGAVFTEYAKHSQERDRTFPERLVHFVQEGSRSLPEREILDRMAELEDKRRRLISIGLLDREDVLRGLTEADVRRVREALTIYVGDIEQKLKVFDAIERRIGALMDIVNSRFKYKRLTLTREHGFRIQSDLGQAIDLQNLSSGEQHELILYYELLFRCPQGGLILVDEPEISLHAEWQARFLTDLINILESSDAYAVVATHSPMIIGPRRDLTVELKGPTLSKDLA